MNLKQELEQIIQDVGHDDIWRPIYDNEGNLLTEGKVDPLEASYADFSKIDFRGKTVLDLGCSFGHYSFLVKSLGAASVLGADIDEKAVRGACILKEMHQFDGVEFKAADFTQYDFKQTFDIGMLISFFGKKMISSGILKYLEALEKLSGNMMVISIRPYYLLDKHFKAAGLNPEGIYPPEYYTEDKFLLRNYILDFFADRWEASQVTPETVDHGLKRTIVFVKK